MQNAAALWCYVGETLDMHESYKVSAAQSKQQQVVFQPGTPSVPAA